MMISLSSGHLPALFYTVHFFHNGSALSSITDRLLFSENSCKHGTESLYSTSGRDLGNYNVLVFLFCFVFVFSNGGA